MNGIQNKKIYILETRCHTRIQFMSLERKTQKVILHATASDLQTQ
jgi:hypothetical protein